MSAERWGMLETQATVLSLAGVGGLRVDGDWEPWGEAAHWIWERESLSSHFNDKMFDWKSLLVANVSTMNTRT